METTLDLLNYNSRNMAQGSTYNIMKCAALRYKIQYNATYTVIHNTRPITNVEQ